MILPVLEAPPGGKLLEVMASKLSPATWRGFFRGLCKDVTRLAGTRGVFGTGKSGDLSWRPASPPSVGCPAVTQRAPWIRFGGVDLKHGQ